MSGWFFAAVGGVALVCAIFSGALLATDMEQRDVARRVRALRQPRGAVLPRSALKGRALLDLLHLCGQGLRRTALVSAKDLAELESAVAAAGLDPRRAAPILIGAKAVLAVLLPALALGYAVLDERSLTGQAGFVACGLVAGLIVPNRALGVLRGSYLKGLQRGLPDALDLLVVCVEAGLGLETAVERVAREMRNTHPAIAVEFTTLAQELRMLPDRRQTLARLGERTNLAAFRSLGATLSQTMRYGTPLGQALRVLAADMRTQRMTALEEKAARLPAMLVLPLILFIMPCLFIVLIGPSALQLMAAMAGK
jgi:tight adherence protein C